MKVNVDFSQIEEFETIPAGPQPVVIETIELKDSKSGPYPYLNFTLVISEGEYEGRKGWFIGSLSPKALFRLKEVFDSFGFEGDQAELEVDDATGILLSPALAGLPATAYFTVEPHHTPAKAAKGATENKVDSLIGTDGVLATATKAAPKGDTLAKKVTKAPPTTSKKVEAVVEEAAPEEEVQVEEEQVADAVAGAETAPEEPTPIASVAAARARPNPFAQTSTAEGTDSPTRKVFK